MDIQNIITLIQAVSDANITNFDMEEGDFKLSLNKVNNKVQVIQESQSVPVIAAAPEVMVASTPKVEEVKINSTPVDENIIEIKSPIVGTFYSSPSPEAGDFVNIGDTIKKGQVICIIEAMKLLNNIESDFDGKVVEVLVKNEQMVEYNQPLFRIKLG